MMSSLAWNALRSDKDTDCKSCRRFSGVVRAYFTGFCIATADAGNCAGQWEEVN